MILTSSSLFAYDGDRILGLWNNKEGDAKIEVFKCGKKYCGRLAWIKEPNYTLEDENGRGGQSRTDDENSDLRMRARPILGLLIMSDFDYAGENVWKGGMVYDPKNGMTYSGMMTLVSPDILHLRGFLLFSIFGRTTEWTRAGR